jgi:circadian clock protein KaiC
LGVRIDLKQFSSLAMNRTMDSTNADLRALAATGIPGLDDVLGGGVARDRLYLIEGMPGSGKTTLALQFLLQGAREGEAVLYCTLSETAEELRAVARSHEWTLDGVVVREFIPSELALGPEEQYTVFHPSEVEFNDTTKAILAEVDQVKPKRIVLDSLSELRLLAGSTLRYRRQILALKQYFTGRGCTVLLLDDRSSTERDLHVQSIAHGVLLLEQLYPEYGAERRRMRVVKYRGQRFRGGNHDYIIQRGGLVIFPRLVSAEHRQHAPRGMLESGIPGLDRLLGGGIERGTSTLVVGAAGAGKSSLAAQFAVLAARRGDRAAMFIFDETLDTLLVRTDQLHQGLREQYVARNVTIQPVDPAELSPGELTTAIRMAVELDGANVIVIDSLNGYMNAMPEERFLVIQLHEILTYLAQRGVVTILVASHLGLLGASMSAPIDASYLADNVIMLRYFEALGEIRQAVSVVKKRSGYHERTIREFRFDDGHIVIGEPLHEFQGVLTGTPVYSGGGDGLIQRTAP